MKKYKPARLADGLPRRAMVLCCLFLICTTLAACNFGVPGMIISRDDAAQVPFGDRQFVSSSGDIEIRFTDLGEHDYAAEVWMRTEDGPEFGAFPARFVALDSPDLYAMVYDLTFATPQLMTGQDYFGLVFLAHRGDGLSISFPVDKLLAGTLDANTEPGSEDPHASAFQEVVVRHGIDLEGLSLTATDIGELKPFLTDLYPALRPELHLEMIASGSEAPAIGAQLGQGYFGGPVWQAGHLLSSDMGPLLIKYAKHLHERGEPWGTHTLSRLAYNGIGGPKNYLRARELAREAVSGGLPQGNNILGILAHGGFGEPVDHAKAERLQKIAADAGDPYAVSNLAWTLIGEGGERVAEGLEILEQEAGRGNFVARYMLGYILFEGIQTERDEARAVALLRQAANARQADSAAVLGIAYETGRGVDTDIQQALDYYETAAMGGIEWAEDRAITAALSADEKRFPQRTLRDWLAAKAGAGSVRSETLLGALNDVGRPAASAVAEMCRRTQLIMPALDSESDVLFYQQTGRSEDGSASYAPREKAASASSCTSFKLNSTGPDTRRTVLHECSYGLGSQASAQLFMELAYNEIKACMPPTTSFAKRIDGEVNIYYVVYSNDRHITIGCLNDLCYDTVKVHWRVRKPGY